MCKRNEEKYGKLTIFRKLPNYKAIYNSKNVQGFNKEQVCFDEDNVLSPNSKELVCIYAYSYKKLYGMVTDTLKQAISSESIAQLDKIIPMEIYGDWEHILLGKWDTNGKSYSLRACLWDDEFGVYDNPKEGYNSENIHSHGYHMITYGLVGGGYTSEYFDFKDDANEPDSIVLSSLPKGQVHAMTSKLYHRVSKPNTPSISLNLTVSTPSTKKDYIEYKLKSGSYFTPDRYVSSEQERAIRTFRKLIRYSYLLGLNDVCEEAKHSHFPEIREEVKTMENYIK